jgi:hypothetical protein
MPRGSRLALLAHVFFCDCCEITALDFPGSWVLCEIGQKLMGWAEREDPSSDCDPLDLSPRRKHDKE